MNRVIITGNLTKDPESRTTQSGVASTTMDVAVQRRFVDKQTGKREADFLRVVCWRQTAEYVQKYATKGTKVAVEGSVQTRSYDAQDGSKRFVTEIIADQVEILTPRQQDGEKHADAAAAMTEVNDPELPF